MCDANVITIDKSQGEESDVIVALLSCNNNDKKSKY